MTLALVAHTSRMKEGRKCRSVTLVGHQHIWGPYDDVASDRAGYNIANALPAWAIPNCYHNHGGICESHLNDTSRFNKQPGSEILSSVDLSFDD